MSKTDKTKERRNEEEGKLLSPKIDVVFQSLFNQKNEEITKDFVQDLIGEEVNNVIINENKELYREFPNDKLGILDLELDVNDKEKVDIEIQLANKDNLAKRLLAYFSKLYSETITIGKNYEKGKRIILVAIIDYSFNLAKKIEYFETEWKLRETKNPQLVLTDVIELHIIELSKIRKNYEKNRKDKKAQWMLFLDNPNSREVQEVMKENEGVKKAIVEVRRLSGDEKLRDIAWRRHIAMLDEQDERETAQRIGREEGREEGIEEGREEGRKEAKIKYEKRKKEIISEMIKNGIDEETIIKIMQIDKSEFENIKKNIEI